MIQLTSSFQQRVAPNKQQIGTEIKNNMPEDENDTGVPNSAEPAAAANSSDPICVSLNNGTCVGVRLPPHVMETTAKSSSSSSSTPFWRSLFAEYLGTLLLVWVVVGSGIMGQQLSDDVGVQLMINSLATIGGLYNIILLLGPVSGCHINPIVSMIEVVQGDGVSVPQWMAYVVVQCLGGMSGALVANTTFAYSFDLAAKSRWGYHLWISEVVSTALLILVIHGNVRSGQSEQIPGAVALLVGAGYFFTSSTIFANPAVTIGRMFSNSFAGIAPLSAGPFIVCQVLGALLGYGLVRILFPQANVKEEECCSNSQQQRQVAFVDMQNAIVSKDCKNQCA